MSGGVALRLDQTELEVALPVLIQRVRNPRRLLLGVGREGGNRLKQHFRWKDRNNASHLGTLSGRREHLWLRISRGVNAPELKGEKAVEIRINDPVIAQKVYGGPIVAKRKSNLAIPVSVDSYGRTPRTFEQETGRKLRVLKQRDKVLLVADLSYTSFRLGDKRFQVEFVLKRRVVQRPDPTALPDPVEFKRALITRAQTISDREITSNLKR